jgi:hypothetical protein
MEIATETAAPTNGTGRGHYQRTDQHRTAISKGLRKASARKKMSEAKKAYWAKKKAAAEVNAPEPLAFSAIERALSATADPGAVTFSMPLAFVLATLSTADLLAELGRRANP